MAAMTESTSVAWCQQGVLRRAGPGLIWGASPLRQEQRYGVGGLMPWISSAAGELTVGEGLESLSLAVERPNDFAHTLARGFEPSEASLDLLCQLRRLFQTRVENIDLGASLFVSRVAATCVANSHDPGRRQ